MIIYTWFIVLLVGGFLLLLFPYIKKLFIKDMDWREYEFFCGEYLTDNWYKNVRVWKWTQDQWIDLYASKDWIKYWFQCKFLKSKVGRPVIQNIVGSCTARNLLSWCFSKSWYTKTAIVESKLTNTLLITL